MSRSQHTLSMPSFCFLSRHRRSLDVLAGDSRTSGGAEAQVARIAASFAARGHKATLIYGSGGDGRTTRLAGVECIDAYPAWGRPATLVHFWRTLAALRPAVIYARLPDDFLALAGLYAARHPETRFVYGLANDQACDPWHTYDYNSWFHNTLYALGLRSAVAVAVQHDDQIELVRPYVRGSIVRIPNLAPDLAAGPRRFDAAAIDVAWVAQIRPAKRLHLLLDLAERLPELRFAVVGGFDMMTPPDERRRLEARIARLANVQFHGPQPAEAVAATLARSKVLLNTSSHEGFPNTMLEAWSFGVPVVSLSIDPGGVIVREQLGLVSGSVERLAADVERLCGSRPLNEACGARGVAYVHNHHGPEAVYRAFAQVLPDSDPWRRALQGGTV